MLHSVVHGMIIIIINKERTHECLAGSTLAVYFMKLVLGRGGGGDNSERESVFDQVEHREILSSTEKSSEMWA